jgi:hypothetical protein
VTHANIQEHQRKARGSHEERPAAQQLRMTQPAAVWLSDPESADGLADRTGPIPAGSITLLNISELQQT